MGPSLVVNKVVSLPVQSVSLLHRDNSSEEVVISPPVDGEGKSQPVCVRVIVHKVHRAKVRNEEALVGDWSLHLLYLGERPVG